MKPKRKPTAQSLWDKYSVESYDGNYMGLYHFKLAILADRRARRERKKKK